MKSQIDIKLPVILDLRNALSFGSSLSGLPPSARYIFDFSAMSTVEPFSLLIASDAIDRFKQTHLTAQLGAKGYEQCGYAGHMGFFRAFGLAYGKAPGEAHGSDTYLPITFGECEDLRRHAADSYCEVGEYVDAWSGRISELLVQTNHGAVYDTVQYSLREIVRNVVEHSESRRFAYCGQYWPSRGRVQVGLLDRGVGLRQTLGTNPRLEVSTDHDAVHLALLPGVSRKGVLPESKASYDPWANSGFGLYMTSRLCSEGGSFVLMSGSSAVQLTNTGKYLHAGAHPGTALLLEFDLTRIDALASRLAVFREEGIRAAKDLFNSSSLTASTASTMLSRNFHKMV